MTLDINPPPVGSLRLYDRVVPPFSPGKYKVEISSSLPIQAGDQPGNKSKFFEVTGPRWNLEPAEVHSKNPSANEPNAPSACYVPTITLQRRTLPWERSLFLDGELPSQFNGGNTPDDANLGVCSSYPNCGPHHYQDCPSRMNDYPSMALLLFTEEELTYRKESPDEYIGIFKGDKALALKDDTTHEHGTEKGIFSNHDANFFSDMNIDSNDYGMLVDAVKVPEYILKNAAPTLEELRLLAHARQVNPQDKEMCGSDADGWFASLICNRVPQPETKYHACLVSLEGRLSENILPISPALNPIPRDIVKKRKRASVGKITAALNLLLAVKWPWSSSVPDATTAEARELNENLTESSENSFSTDLDLDAPTSMQAQDLDQRPDFGVPNVSLSVVRLVLLHHWTFNTGTGGDFESRMKRLKVRVRSRGSSVHREGDLVEKVPFHEDNSHLSSSAIAEPMLLGNSMVTDVTANSYLKMDMVESNGELVECLYRGPFTALPEYHQIKEKPYANSDEARAIIQEIGMEEISHASAFELGRLLAFNDHNFVKTAARWRQTTYIRKLIASNVAQINSELLDDNWAGGVSALAASSQISDALLNKGLKVLSTPPRNLIQAYVDLPEIMERVDTTPPLTGDDTGGLTLPHSELELEGLTDALTLDFVMGLGLNLDEETGFGGVPE